MSNVSMINGHIDEPKGLTDEQIVKALECCKSKGGTCNGCAFSGYRWCIGALHYETLDLINRLKADKEALIATNESMMRCLEKKKEIITELDNEIERLRGGKEGK